VFPKHSKGFKVPPLPPAKRPSYCLAKLERGIPHFIWDGAFGCLPEARKCRGIPHFGWDGIKSKLKATAAEELAQKHFHFSPSLWLTKGGIGLKF